MEYAHEEVIRELEITVNNLPSEIKNKIRSWNNKKRLATKIETIESLEKESEDIADDITAWHYANNDEEEEEEEELKAPKPQVLDTSNDVNLVVEKPAPIVTPEVTPNNVVSHVANPEVVEEHNKEEKKSSWGINLDW